jgi:hypothetical protein
VRAMTSDQRRSVIQSWNFHVTRGKFQTLFDGESESVIFPSQANLPVRSIVPSIQFNKNRRREQ